MKAEAGTVGFKPLKRDFANKRDDTRQIRG